jgi:Arm DNA-binding domain
LTPPVGVTRAPSRDVQKCPESVCFPSFLLVLCPPEFGEMRVLPINLMVSLMASRRSLESDTIMGLTASAIKAPQCRAKDYKLADSNGLYLLVKPSGGRYWRMNYRFRGYQKTLSFGAWPEVALIDARHKRHEARREIARGIDPGEKLKLDRIAAEITPHELLGYYGKLKGVGVMSPPSASARFAVRFSAMGLQRRAPTVMLLRIYAAHSSFPKSPTGPQSQRPMKPVPCFAQSKVLRVIRQQMLR